MIKRIIIFLILTVLFMPNIVYGTDKIINEQMKLLDISSFIQEGENYTKDIFPEIDLNDILVSSINGTMDNNTIFAKIINLFGDEVLKSISLVGTILVVIVIHSILKNITDNLENKGIGQVAYYVEYILIVTLVMSNFSGIINSIKESIYNLISFMDCLIPILLALMTATGNIVSTSAIEPIILLAIVFIGNTITSFILPVVLISVSISIVSNLSEEIQIGKLSKFLKSSIIWILGIIVTLFITILSFESTITSNIDAVTSKSLKGAAATFIPVVGKALGDSVDMVLGSATILKNSIGVVGIVVVIGICVIPIIKLACLTVIYYFAAAISEPLADKKIVALLGEMGETFKVLLGIMFFVSIMLIIGLGICIKITTS